MHIYIYTYIIYMLGRPEIFLTNDKEVLIAFPYIETILFLLQFYKGTSIFIAYHFLHI